MGWLLLPHFFLFIYKRRNMNLMTIKDVFQETSKQHKDVKGFAYGSNYDIAVEKNTDYPITFLEVPFFFNYDIEDQNFEEITIGFYVFVRTEVDDRERDYESITYAKFIGDAIIKYINEFVDEIKIGSYNGITIRQFGDDSVAGIRYDINVIMPPLCIEDFNDFFYGE